ncbi:MAG TPA: glycosyltransferase family 4 protein, partial [Herpetosiphonaceae bacterium]
PAEAGGRGSLLRRWLAPDRLRLISGFHHPEAGDGRPFAWTGRRAELELTQGSSKPPSELQVQLHSGSPPGVEPATIRLSANGELLGERALPRTGEWLDWRIPLPPRLAAAQRLRIRLDATTFNPRQLGLNEDSRDLGVGVGAVRLLRGGWSARLAERLRTGVPDQRAYAGVSAHRLQAIAQAYDDVLAISRFTQEWIERRWHVASSVIYPPVATDQFHPGAKRPLIASVGRFFAGSHNKKHLVMIQAFRELCDAGLRGWEYHLIGGCDEAMPEHRDYLAQVRAAAEGYPITLHVNAPFATMQQIYSEAKLFWHATGHGNDENADPDSFEHFGITTVEAMAAGCVPVVIAKAGQLETVEHDRSGLHWHSVGELRAHTQRLIDDPALWGRLHEGALARSRQFDYQSFARQVRERLL